MVLVPGLTRRLALPAGDNPDEGLDTMTKNERYHADYVSLRRVEKTVAVSPEAVEIEKRAIAREKLGQYRLASALWLKCFDAAMGDVERARISVRRSQCIAMSNGLRRGDYSGLGCGGVVHE